MRGEYGGDRYAYGIVAVLAGIAHRSSMFENGNKSNACSALGGARGGRF